jgi:hypothetical protein
VSVCSTTRATRPAGASGSAPLHDMKAFPRSDSRCLAALLIKRVADERAATGRSSLTTEEGAFVADHQVNLDPDSDEFEAFAKLDHLLLAGRSDRQLERRPGFWAGSAAGSVTRCSARSAPGSCGTGRPGPGPAAQDPAHAELLAYRHVELAHVGGRLAMQRGGPAGGGRLGRAAHLWTRAAGRAAAGDRRRPPRPDLRPRAGRVAGPGQRVDQAGYLVLVRLGRRHRRPAAALLGIHTEPAGQDPAGPGQTQNGEGVLPAVAAALVRQAGCAVPAMRYPVAPRARRSSGRPWPGWPAMGTARRTRVGPGSSGCTCLPRPTACRSTGAWPAPRLGERDRGRVAGRRAQAAAGRLTVIGDKGFAGVHFEGRPTELDAVFVRPD